MKNYLRKVIITGGEGQLGCALRDHILAKEFHLAICPRDLIDITDPTSITNAFDRFSPDIVINSAAYTAVDKAEQEQEQCMRVNHQGARNIAAACQALQIPLIHLSTDYVFDGTSQSPYREDDAANPINCYGSSKWQGEQAVREQCEQHIILRTSAIFSEYGNNFLKTILRLAKERKVLRIVADQVTCPTYAGHLASAIYTIAKQPSHWGTYHYCDAMPASWHEFAAAILEMARQHQPLLVETIDAITTADYPTPAKRPAYSVLNCSKIEKYFGMTQANWAEAIKQITNAILRVSP